MMYVLVMICSISAPKCDAEHARVYQACRAPPGIIVRGVPASLSIVQSDLRPASDEYLSVKCKISN